MAEGKVNLPDDLASPKISDLSWIGKDAAGGAGMDDGKNMMGFHDEGKDHLGSESSVPLGPLSPQWLYAKPTESRANFSLASGKDIRVLDGVQDKKEWRRPVPEIESNRRWREEERETGLPGRRDRKKDGDRETDHRKNDRRTDNVTAREAVDVKAVPVNERWNDGSVRNPVHENRRDSKWSTRWGPDDKEESRADRKLETEKEDAQSEKQSFISTRVSSESDSRDKWRPRIRQESSLGATVYRAAPGFGLERGRGDGSTKGFVSGRGRSNIRNPSTGSIGTPLSNRNEFTVGISSSFPVKFRYPRGKLLDIYRTHLPFDATPVGLEAPGVVISNFVEPLAFVAPVEEEEAVLDDIWLGNITSSDVFHGSKKDEEAGNGKDGRGSDVGLEDSHTKHSSISELGFTDSDSGVAYEGTQIKNGPSGSVKVSADELTSLHTLIFDGFGEVNAHSNLPEDSSFLLDASLSHTVGVTLNPHIKGDNEIVLPGRQTPPEEWSLFYQDPQGEVQGPFLGVDIISWFQQGFFGTDLPVCLSDAPEGTPFQELGVIMPHLKLEAPRSSAVTENDILKSSNVAVDELDFSDPCLPDDTDKKWLQPVIESDGNLLGQPTLSKPEMLPMRSTTDTTLEFQDEFLHSLPDMGSRFQNDNFLYQSTSSDPLLRSHEVLDDNLTDPLLPADNNANPLKALYSELEAISQKRPLSSNIPGMANSESFPYSTMGRDPPLSRLQQEPLGSFTKPSPIFEALANNSRRMSDSNFLTEDTDNYGMPRIEQSTSQFNLEEHILQQQLQKHHVHHQHVPNLHQAMNLNESFLDQIPGLRHQQQSANQHAIAEHLLKLQLHQQQLLKLQQQRQHQKQLQQLQQQQLHHHQLQLMQQQQQQQQSIAQQLLLQQLMQQPTRESSFASSSDSLHGRSLLDHVLRRQQHMHEHQSLHPSRHHDLALEQLLQAKSVQSFQDEHKIRQAHLLEQQLLGRQLEQRQTSTFSGTRHLQRMEDDGRGTSGLWSMDDSQFVGGSLPSQSTALNQLDIIRRLQRQASFDHQSQIERDMAMNNRIQRGLYESGLQSFDTPVSMPAGNHGLHMDRVNSLSRVRGVAQEQKGQMSLAQIEQFPSGILSQQHQVSGRFPTSHSDALEMHWSDANKHLPDNFAETQFSRFPQSTEGQSHAMKAKYGNDNQNAWLRASENDDLSRRVVLELLRRKEAAYPPESFENSDRTYNQMYEVREPSWHPARNVPDHSSGLLSEGIADYLPEAAHYSKIAQDQSAILGMNGTTNGLVIGERLSDRSGHGTLIEDEQFLTRLSQTGESVSAGSSLDAGDYFGSKGNITHAYSLEDPESGVDVRGSLVDMDFPVDAPVRNSSAQSSGSNLGFISEGGSDSVYSNDIRIERSSMVPNASVIPPRGVLNLQVPPSQQGLADLASAHSFKGKMLNVSSEAIRQGGSAQVSDNSNSAKRDFRISRIPSIGESDTPEASSYVEMLKAPRKTPILEADSISGSLEAESAQGAKSNKKKGKKGRQIDPSLLGFKVHSNRIMMGEIQRLDN